MRCHLATATGVIRRSLALHDRMHIVTAPDVSRQILPSVTGLPLVHPPWIALHSLPSAISRCLKAKIVLAGPKSIFCKLA